MEHLLAAFVDVVQPLSLLFLLLGVGVGVTVGAIPGLSGAMVIALALPLTYFMQPTHALTLLVSMYVGATAGGLISATLMRMPGTPAALMTVLDGYPMARRGEPGRALGFGITASFAGGMISWLFLAILSPPLAELAVRFGPYELFSMVLVALVLIAAVSRGSLIIGLLSGFFGVLVSMVGNDPSSGVTRLTGDIFDLSAGFRLLPVILGMLVLSQVIDDILNIGARVERIGTTFRGMFMSLADLRRQTWNMIRSSLIGTWIGILPGIGGTTAAIASYTTAKTLSKTPEKFGTGTEDGIVAAETANNAAVNGALVPLITLGIPGSVIDVILLGAMILHNLTPGPLLFSQNPEIAYGVIAAALIANIAMFVLMILATPLFARLMYVNRGYLLPAIMVFCVIGAFATGNRMFDVWVMIGFGIIGFLMARARIPLGPFIIGYILAPIAERELRSGLMVYDGSFWPLVTRPVSAVLIALAVLTLLLPWLRDWMDALARRRRREEQGRQRG